VIMDGNGRWAQAQGLPRILGHKAGVEAVRRTLEACSTIGVEALTLFSFSSENWKRPREEVEALMGLLLLQLRKERDGLLRNNIRLRHLGRREGLPDEALRELDAVVEATSTCTGPTLCLALNYGSRAEIVDAVRTIARRAIEGGLSPDAIDEACIDGALNTAGLPDPDLLIRTAGERRLSNFLLWQISYAEIHVTEKHWPDFAADDLYAAVRDYAGRDRRFGGIDSGQPGDAD